MTNNEQRAADMRAEMLTSLGKVRQNERLYDQVKREHEERVRAGNPRLRADEPLPPELAKLAEQNADRDAVAVQSGKNVVYHTQRAVAFGIGYLVEVSYAGRAAERAAAAIYGDRPPGVYPR